jgi:hypothetical protein
MSAKIDSREEAWVQILLVLLCAGALVPIWIAPFPPLQDLSSHLLKVDILRRWIQGETFVRQIYSLNLKLHANYTLYGVVLALSPFFSLLNAARIFLSLIVAGLPLSAYAFLRRVNPESTLFALAVPALNFNLHLMMGSLNYCLALSLYLAALTIFLARGHPRWRPDLLFTFLATVLYFTHGFVFLALVGTVAILLTIDFRGSGLRRGAGLLPGLFCFATTLADTLKSGDHAAGALRPYFRGVGLHSLKSAVVWLIDPHGWGYDTYFTLAWLAALGSCYLSEIIAAGVSVRKTPNLKEALRRNAWLIVATLLLAGFVLSPVQLRDWNHVRPRFIPLAVLTLLGALRLPARKSLRLALLAILVLAAIAVEARNTREFKTGGARVQEYLAGMQDVEDRAAVVPVENPEAGPRYGINLHSWAYYSISRESWSPYLQAQPSYSPVIYKVVPWGPTEGQPLGPEMTIRRMAACYDYVLLWNSKEGDAAALRPYFVVVRATAHLHLWRNRLGVRRNTPESNPACASEPGSTAPSSAQ